MRADSQLPRQLAIAQNLNSGSFAIGKACLAKRILIDSGAFCEPVQGVEINRQITRCVPGVVKPAFWDSTNERHLAAFKSDADGTAGPSRLALASTTGGFAMPAGFTLTKALAAVFRAGTRLQIM